MHLPSALLQNVPRTIRRTLVRQFRDGGEALSPKLSEGLTGEQKITLILAEQLLIREIEIKYARMVMRTLQLFAILAAVVVADIPIGKLLASPFHELLEITLE